jgi:hypothetical protein
VPSVAARVWAALTASRCRAFAIVASLAAMRDGAASGCSPSYVEAVRLQAQALRYRAHDKLMRAFLDPEVFEGLVHVRRSEQPAAQPSLLEEA